MMQQVQAFLFALGLVLATACTPPTPAQVAGGALPALDKRLPDSPLIVGVNDGVGKYGGTLTTAIFPPEGYFRALMYDPPVRWKEDYSGYEPGWAEKWDYSADGKTVTFTIRKGLKWSDGQPFTTADLLFAWDDLAQYPTSGYQPNFWMLNADGTPMEVRAVRDTVFSFTFKEPQGTVPDQLAQGYWENAFWMKPKHFLSQFHPRYNPDNKDFSALISKDDFINTPGYPTLGAWVTTDFKAGERIVLDRNPYYWKLDPQGNQLPYVDKVVALYVNDDEVRLLKALQGEFDVLWRGVGALNLTTLNERLLLTVILTLATLVFTYAVAIPIGVYSATHQYSVGDYILRFIGFVGMSIPPFMLALIVMFLVVMHGNQSVGGLFSPAFIDQPWSIAKVLDLLGHLWVPVVIIGSAGTASLIRIVRANMLDVLGQQFVTTARAKGLRESLVVYKHALRVAINPLISIVGLTLPRIIEGEALAAIVMNLPTTGPVYLGALQTLDMYLAGTFLMFLATFLVLGNLVADMLLALVDPRIRLE